MSHLLCRSCHTRLALIPKGKKAEIHVIQSPPHSLAVRVTSRRRLALGPPGRRAAGPPGRRQRGPGHDATGATAAQAELDSTI